MYVPRPCTHKGCGRPALAESNACVVHHSDARAHVREILGAARGAHGLRDLDLTGITLEDEDLDGMEIRAAGSRRQPSRACGCQRQAST